MNVVLISTYELGHQPFGLASPAAWLRGAWRAGHLPRPLAATLGGPLAAAVSAADLIAFYVPMHTATRLAAQLLDTVRRTESRRAYLFLRPLRSRSTRRICAAWAWRRFWAANSRMGWRGCTRGFAEQGSAGTKWG